MNFAKSSFCYKGRAKSSDQMEVEADFMNRIEAICLEFPRYGYRRVSQQLKREGWQVNHKKVLRLVRDMAINNRHPAPGIIHHSDQGVQYASREYVEELKSHGFDISMSRKRNPYDNATMESFSKTLKYEQVYFCKYKTLADVMNRLPYFIEEVYSIKENPNLEYISLQKSSFIVVSYPLEKDAGVDKPSMIETWQRVTEKANS